jgi:3'-phosphoadenosine 5'-phosphosulfate sulfotransferase
MLPRCFALTDEMLGGDEDLQEVTQIRVVKHLCGWPNEVKALGGPRLQALVAYLCDWRREAFPDAPKPD